MGWKSFALGVVVGAAALGAVAHLPRPASKVAEDETIIFSDKTFFDTGTTGIGDGALMFSGTSSGEHVGYKNNTLSATCVEADMRCVVASAAQIGRDQVNNINIDDWQVTQWSPSLIVAKYEGLCGTSTINVLRSSESIGYVVEPTNQSKPMCDRSDSQIHKWTVGRSLYWAHADPENLKGVK